jgi:polar amino acid transport system permease protein
MSSDQLTTAAPPGARRAVPFRGNLRTASIVAVASFGVAALTWAMLWKFDQSLSVDTAHHIAAIVIEIALALLTLAVPWYGILTLAASLRARKLAREDFRYQANIAIEDSRDRIWVVVGIGLAALVVAFLAFVLAANHGSVRSVMFNMSNIWSSRTAVLRGFWINVRMFIVAEAIVLVWALVIAVVRLLPGRAAAPVRILAIVYTDVLRGVPAIITIYLVGFGFALAGVWPFNHLTGNTQLFWLGVFALVLVYGAYVAEVYRAGLESVHWSQTAAARGLGLTQWQTLRHVVIPQAIRRIMPPLLNDFVALQKDTALVSILGVVEALGAAQLLKNQQFNLSPVTGAAICFLVITIPFTRLVDYLIKRDRERTMAQ